MTDNRWNLSWHHESLGIAELWNQQITGRSVTVAILDTGLARPFGLDRDDFEYLDARGQRTSPYDLNGHGTSCASVIASYASGALGIAPEAKIVSLRVLETGNEAEDIEDAMSFLLKSRLDVDVVSCSFVVSKATSSLRELVRDLRNTGKVVVGAAGDTAASSADFPEQTQNVVTVAAITRNMKAIAGAETGAWIDLCAPGEAIPVVAPGRTVLFGESSAAAAVVSGVAALALSTKPAGSARQALARGLEGMLKASATPLPDLPPESVGAGLVNPNALIQLARSIP